MVNQAVGLAEALGLDYDVRPIHPRWPWRALPAEWPLFPLASLPKAERFSPPWPRVLISCGRRSFPIAAALKRKLGDDLFAIHVQNPGGKLSAVDVVVAPEHDGISGPNVISTLGAIHRVTPQRLRSEAENLAPSLAQLPQPYITVLIGGPNRRYEFGPELIDGFGDNLKSIAMKAGASLLVTPSRRTPPEMVARLRAKLIDVPHVVWDGSGPNPYFGWLGLASHVVVTCDSVSMITEACATGKPVHVLFWEGGSKRFKAFYQSLMQRGYIRAFTGDFESWSYEPLLETPRVARLIRDMMALRGVPVSLRR
jgi:mitochondrial fission protein ELM1